MVYKGRDPPSAQADYEQVERAKSSLLEDN